MKRWFIVGRADARDVAVESRHAYEYRVRFKWNDHTVRCQEFLTLMPPVMFDSNR